MKEHVHLMAKATLKKSFKAFHSRQGRDQPMSRTGAWQKLDGAVIWSMERECRCSILAKYLLQVKILDGYMDLLRIDQSTSLPSRTVANYAHLSVTHLGGHAHL